MEELGSGKGEDIYHDGLQLEEICSWRGEDINRSDPSSKLSRKLMLYTEFAVGRVLQLEGRRHQSLGPIEQTQQEAEEEGRNRKQALN